VPTSQDFEDEAFEKVTPANFRAEFARLKTDISKPWTIARPAAFTAGLA